MTGSPRPGAPGATAAAAESSPTTPLTPLHPLRDEAALEQLFRAHFAVLADEAKEHLGEGAASGAPRVVEAAFRQAWEERQRLTTEPEVMAFLKKAVHACAARELSRRAAAHHLGGKGAPAAAHHGAPAAAPDVDQAWTHFYRQLHPEQRGQHVDHAQAEVLRHEAAQHLGALGKRRSWAIPVAVATLGVALTVGGVWWIDRLGADRRVTNALASSDTRRQTAAAGQFAIVTLDDATKVTLAPMSTLVVPKRFGIDMRAVRIEGAATFVVTPGQMNIPFQIRAGNAAVLVTGTTITVRAYTGEPAVLVQVRDGQAVLRIGEQEHLMISGRALLADSGGAVREPSAAELAEATGWSERRLTLTNRPLRDVVAQMNRFYGEDIKVPEARLLDSRATVDASLDSLRTAITQVEQSANAEFGWEGQTMVFRTKKEGAAAKKR